MKIYQFNDKSNLVGERVKLRRDEMGLSQIALAAQLQVNGVNLTRDAIGKIESGKRFVADFEALYLAKVLKVDLMWLLTGEES